MELLLVKFAGIVDPLFLLGLANLPLSPPLTACCPAAKSRPQFSVLEDQLKMLRQSPMALEPAGFDVDMFNDDLAQKLLCGVCCNVYNNPHVCPCGHTFCLHCIGRWLDMGHTNCPMDRQPVQRSKLIPCLALNAILDDLQVACPE